jgi:hypothetical protein
MNKSILHEVLPIVNDNSLTLHEKQTILIKHILSTCKDPQVKMRMIEQIASQRINRTLVELVYNLVLKFEGAGTIKTY